MAHPEKLDIRGIRATRANVDLDAIEGNVRLLRGALPETTRLMAVVKADGYGHGAPWVARAALNAGAALLGVATVGEGEAVAGAWHRCAHRAARFDRRVRSRGRM